MTQTTGGMSPTEQYVGLSANGSAWTDVSGFANSVEVSGGERASGAAHTFDGDTPIVKAGKRAPLTITIRGVFTQKSNEFFDMVKDAYEAGSALYARWSPGGGDAGDLGYTTSAGIVKNNPYPGGSVDDANPIMTELVLEVATVTESTLGTAGW